MQHDSISYPYARHTIDEDDIAEVTAALKGDLITRGAKVSAFEEALANYCEAKYAVAFNNATSALHAAYYAAKIGPYDHVITSPNTFIGSVTGALIAGAQLKLADIDPESGNLDLKYFQPRLSLPSSRGRLCIVPIHFAGAPIAMETLEQCLIDPDTVIIEDAAHALGAKYSNGKKVGCCQWSNMTIFSFHPAKTITTGEGGAVLTNDEELLHLLKRFRNNGIENREHTLSSPSPGPWYYEVHDKTGNFHLTDFQAALGLSQLKKVEQFVQKRARLVACYREKLGNLPHLKMLSGNLDSDSAHHLFVVLIDFEKLTLSRAQLMEELKKKGIGTQVHYIPLYRHPLLRDQQEEEMYASFPHMERYYAQALSLPLYYSLEESDVAKICNELIAGLVKK